MKNVPGEHVPSMLIEGLFSAQIRQFFTLTLLSGRYFVNK